MFDTDGSGSIDAKEIKNVLQELGCPAEEIEGALSEMMAEADADGDKKSILQRVQGCSFEKLKIILHKTLQ